MKIATRSNLVPFAQTDHVSQILTQDIPYIIKYVPIVKILIIGISPIVYAGTPLP